MPRVSPTTEVDNVEKKTPRKKAAPKKRVTGGKGKVAATRQTTSKSTPKKTATKKAPSKTARKTATKKTVKEELVESQTTEVEKKEVAAKISKRKAPTGFANEAAKKRAFKTQAIVVCLLVTVGVGASAAVGFTDSKAGQIDVAQTIKEQNARMADMVDVDGPTVVSPSPDGGTVPDSSLIPSADQSARTVAPAQITETASSTATSTDSTATSTIDGVESAPDANSTSVIDTATTTVTAVNQEREPETNPEEPQSENTEPTNPPAAATE